MTCVVALRIWEGEEIPDDNDHTIFIAADSIATDGSTKSHICDGKLERIGKYRIGWAGTMGHAQAALCFIRQNEHALENLKSGEFSCALRRWVKSQSIDDYSAGLLIVSEEGIFEVDSEFGVTDHASDFAAIGTGGQLALGVLFATEGSGMRAKARLELALKAAAEFDSSTGGSTVIDKI